MTALRVLLLEIEKYSCAPFDSGEQHPEISRRPERILQTAPRTFQDARIQAATDNTKPFKSVGKRTEDCNHLTYV